MNKVLTWIWKHFDDVITVVMFLGLFFVVLLQMVLRIVFNDGMVWTEELSRLFLMYACFAALPRVLKRRNELKLTIVVNKLNHKNKCIFDIAVQVITIATFAFLAYWGIETVEFQSTNILPALRFSMAWMYIAFPLSMIAGIIRAIELIVADVKNMGREAETWT